MFVISGVTGNTGSVVAQTLIEQGQSVRVIVRSEEKGAPWKAQGAEVAVADIMDVEAMTQALEGASGAYFLLPSDLMNEDFIGDSRKRAEAIIKAASDARLPHAVFFHRSVRNMPIMWGPYPRLLTLKNCSKRLPSL